MLNSYTRIILRLVSSRASKRFKFLGHGRTARPATLISAFQFRCLGTFRRERRVTRLEGVQSVPFAQEEGVRLTRAIATVIGTCLIKGFDFRFLSLRGVIRGLTSVVGLLTIRARVAYLFRGAKVVLFRRDSAANEETGRVVMQARRFFRARHRPYQFVLRSNVYR